MLRPDKHTNPVLSVANVTGLIIEQFKQEEIINYDDLIVTLVNKTSNSVKEIFPFSLSFLFILDKVEYIPDLDAFRLKV